MDVENRVNELIKTDGSPEDLDATPGGHIEGAKDDTVVDTNIGTAGLGERTDASSEHVDGAAGIGVELFTDRAVEQVERAALPGVEVAFYLPAEDVELDVRAAAVRGPCVEATQERAAVEEVELAVGAERVPAKEGGCDGLGVSKTSPSPA